MATAAENIDTAITQISALIVEVTVDPKPSYTNQGRTVGWTEYLGVLTDKLAVLQKAKATLSGPGMIMRMGRAG